MADNANPSQSPRPELDAAMMALDASLRAQRRLPSRLVELVRLRVAFHNQCRPCMSIRYRDAVDDGLDEGLVCALEDPEAPSDMSEAERVAVLYADRFATDHLSIDADLLAELGRHFTAGEIRELAIQTAFFTGFGRMGAVFDGGEALPVGARPADGTRLTPWGIEPVVMRA